MCGEEEDYNNLSIDDKKIIDELLEYFKIEV